MMKVRYLADTQILLWYVSGSSLLPLTVREQLTSDADVYFSIESLRGIAIKAALGKPRFGYDAREIYEFLIDSSWLELPISAAHIFALSELPLLHGDPFDRMLVAQAQVEGMVLVTSDWMLRQYPVPILDAG